MDGSVTISLRNFVGEGINITTTVIRVVMVMLFNATYNHGRDHSKTHLEIE
jgi:hypothetical protein